MVDIIGRINSKYLYVMFANKNTQLHFQLLFNMNLDWKCSLIDIC